VSVVQLYAGRFPGLMLTGLYILYVIIVAKLRPDWAPPPSAADRVVPLPLLTQKLTSSGDTYALTNAMKGSAIRCAAGTRAAPAVDRGVARAAVPCWCL
jgi:TRAP-type mannitol/chloroaromatic compound transport system permease large subunit